MLLFLAAAGEVGTARRCESQELLGSEFQVNTYTTGYQYNPTVAGRTSGDFVVVWESFPQLGKAAATDIFAQRFGGDGSRVGTEFQVNSYTHGYQYSPHVDMSEDGSFVVVWVDSARSSYGSNLFAQRFDASGAAVGDEFQVNSTLEGYSNNPRISVDTGGKSVVVWWREPAPDPDEQSEGIFARRFNAAGNPMGSEFQVDASTSGQQFPDIDHDASNNFMVVWSGPYAGTVDIHARLFSSEGVAIGSELHVVQQGTDEYPRVNGAGTSGFIVVWQNGGDPAGLDGSESGVFAQRFGPDGTRAGVSFQVNGYTTDTQTNPVVAADADGAFVVAWESYGQASVTGDIFARPYDETSDPLGGEFKVDSFDYRGQYKPEIASLGADEFVVVWQVFTQDGDTQGVFGQRIAASISPPPDCGDADASGTVTSADALFALRAAVGSVSCEGCVCDVDNTGSVSAADALALLHVAVGQPLELLCPSCGGA